jgi:ABC-type lipoprotein release transport system permease subunit
MVDDGDAAAILVVPGTFYPNGRLRAVLLKGIDPGQRVLALPTAPLATADEDIPLLIGQRTARACGLAAGDTVTLQWRDAAGTIDARDARVVEVMRTPVQSVDLNQVWLPLERLRGLAGMPGEATLVVADRDATLPAAGPWRNRSQGELLADVRSLVRSKAIGAAIVYVLLLFLSMLAIFDTQVLSLFRRRKEIGTLMALGMPRGTVAALFTLEGALHGVLAVAVGALYGAPLLARFAAVGWKLSVKADSYGFALGDTLYPVYSLCVVGLTLLGLLLVTTFVSFLPTRRIASLQPTEALRGRLG